MKVITRKASVHRLAGAKDGARLVPTESSALQGSPPLRTGQRRSHSGTNAAELIAAAHACSFSRALAHELGRVALSTGDILTLSSVTLEHLAAGWTIMKVHLNVVARLPKVTQDKFIEAAVRAKTTCFVSRVLRTTISMHAKLEK